jgi:hypothetical protein
VIDGVYSVKNKEPEDYVALEIEVDFITGERAGKLSPRDPGLICLNLWQDLDAGIEMRLMTDDRDVTQYEGIDGVTIHRGAKAINERVKELFKPRLSITNTDLFRESVRGSWWGRGKINLTNIDANLDPDEQLRKCKEQGALGIKTQNPSTLKED